MKINLIYDELNCRSALEKLSEKFGFAQSEDGIGTKISATTGDPRAEYENGVLTVKAKTLPGALYAVKAVSDKIAVFEKRGELPEKFSETFHPSFRMTYMLDCSRNAVAKVQTVKTLIEHLAVCGYEGLMLYTEDTFEVKKYPYFGYLRNPYTKGDIREIDEYCVLFGIELIPCIQTLAHFNTLLRHYAMADMFDVNDILMVGEDKTYEFIESLIAACAEYFTSRRINIGMDEAHMLGRGKYMDKHGARKRFDIMKEHLAKVSAICEKYGFAPMMWSDMFFGQILSGEFKSRKDSGLPENVELIYWDYYSTSEEHYDENIKKHRALGENTGFAGGAWKWLGFTPDNRYSLAATKSAARACEKNAIKDFIVTGWGDNGAECSVFATLPAIMYAGRASYGKYEIDDEFKNAFETYSGGMSYGDFMSIDLCNRVTERNDAEERNSANKYLLFNDPLLGTLDTVVERGQGALYERHRQRLSLAERRAGRWAYLFETQKKLASVLAAKAELGIRLREAYQKGDREELEKQFSVLHGVRSKVQSFYCAFYAQWQTENRPNGFDVQDLRIGALLQRLKTAERKIGDYLTGRADEVPELGEKLLCFMGHGEEFEKDFDQCEYRWLRMTSVNVNE